MAKTGIFDVDIDEAFRVTASDIDHLDTVIDRSSSEYGPHGQENPSWPYHLDQDNCQPDTASTPTIDHPRQRFQRPESVGKASPGFVYSRPEIKLPDQRRNLGGKMQNEPMVTTVRGHELAAHQDQEMHHKDEKTLTMGLSDEPLPGEPCKGQSSLQRAVLSTLRDASAKSKVTVKPHAECPNERDEVGASEKLDRQTSPGEIVHPSETDHGQSNKRPGPSPAPIMANPLPKMIRNNAAAPIHGIQKMPDESPLLITHNIVYGVSKSSSDRNSASSIARERPSHHINSILKPYTTGKIEKRKTRRQTREPRIQPTIEQARHVPDQVEILQILAFRAKQERDAHQATTRDLEEHKDQLNQIKSGYLELETQLNQGLEREHAQHSELQRFKSLLSGLKGKAKKLDDYIRGLSNDHNKLRDDAISLRQQSESLQSDRQVIQTALADTRSTLQHLKMIDRGALAEARQQLGNLQKVINQQHGQLMDKSDLLDTERKRLRFLEGELTRIATSQERMAESMRGDQKELLKELQVILEQNQISSRNEADKTVIPPAALTHCVELLEQIHNRRVVEPEELHQVGKCIQAQLESITTTIKKTNKGLDGHFGTEMNLLSRFEALISGFKSQEDLVEKAALLHEAETVLRERTQASETLLALSRQQINDLQDRETTHLQSIANLQAKINAPVTPMEDPRLLQRVNQLESRNHELQQEAVNLQVMTDTLKEQNNVQDGRLVVAAEKIRQGEAAVEEVKNLTVKIEQVKAEYSMQANLQLESLRQELSRASMEEKRLIARDHANVLHQLQRQLSLSRDNGGIMEEKLKNTTRVQEEQIQALDAMRARIGQYVYEKNEDQKSIKHLEHQLQEATQAALSKDAEIQNLEEANAAFEKDTKEARLQRDEAAHKLATQIADTASKHTGILAQINALCARGDETLKPANAIEDALMILARQVDSLRNNSEASQATFVATQNQSQELLFSSEPEPVNRNGPSNSSEDATLISQDKGFQDQAALPASKSMPRAPRSRAASRLRITPFQDMFQESHVEKTTTTRSVKRMRSSHGFADKVIQAESPSKGRDVVTGLTSMSEFNKGLEKTTQDSPAIENMGDFFPQTPLQPAWPQSTTHSSHSMAGKTPTAPDTNGERDIPSILKRPTSSVIRGDLGTSPTPLRSTHFRSKTRVEASSSKTRKSLETTTETIKESSTIPKGILKPSSSKRNATDALLETTSQPNRRRAGTLGSGLGPIMSSQSRESQGASMPKVEGKKKGVKRRGSGKDKYQERFVGGV